MKKNIKMLKYDWEAGPPWEVEEEEGDDGGEEDGGEGHLLAVLVLSPAPSCFPPLQRCTVLPAGWDCFRMLREKSTISNGFKLDFMK